MNQTENQLILNAQKGDMAAFEELVYKYDRHVLGIAKSFRNNDDDAKDIYQEVFLRVFRGLKNFQFKSEFSTWLFRITTNVCLTYQSRKKEYDSLDKEVYMDDESPVTLSETLISENNSDSLAIGSDLMNHISSAVDELPPQQKMVFTLKYFQEYKIKEIADMMQCSEGAVKKYLFTATHKMRNSLKNIMQEKK